MQFIHGSCLKHKWIYFPIMNRIGSHRVKALCCLRSSEVSSQCNKSCLFYTSRYCRFDVFIIFQRSAWYDIPWFKLVQVSKNPDFPRWKMDACFKQWKRLFPLFIGKSRWCTSQPVMLLEFLDDWDCVRSLLLFDVLLFFLLLSMFISLVFFPNISTKL